VSAARPVLPLPIVMLVTDRHACNDRRLEDVVEAAVEGGVNVVQLREKDLPARELYELALWLRQIVGTQALLLVNDRIDVALASGAHGAELGGTGLPTEIARKPAPDLLIGRSVHGVANAAEAVSPSHGVRSKSVEGKESASCGTTVRQGSTAFTSTTSSRARGRRSCWSMAGQSSGIAGVR